MPALRPQPFIALLQRSSRFPRAPFGSFPMPEVLEVAYKLCLNDWALPVEKKTLHLQDPDGLALDEHQVDENDELTVNLIHFGASKNLRWLEQALKLPARWWVLNSTRILVLIEIRNAIKDSRKHYQKRQQVINQDLLLIQLRGKILCVQNLATSVILGLPHGANDTSTLLWFLNELQKDIEGLEEAPTKKKNTSEEHPAGVQECLERLHEHPECASAHYQASRLSFKVIKKDKSSRTFRIRGLRKQDDEGNDAFTMALSLALTFLESSEPAPQEPEDLDDDSVGASQSSQA